MVSVLYKDFYGWSKPEWLYLVLALVLVCIGSWAASPLEFAAALTNVLCVLLVAKGRISNYYWGLAGVVLYAIVAYNAGLYGNMTLNIIYAPLQLWGYYEWHKATRAKATAKNDVPVRTLTANQLLIVIALLLLAVAVVSWYLANHTQDPAPLPDAFTLVASLVAMWLMIKQYSEQWILWNLVNAVSIYLWVIPALSEPGSWAMVAMWSVFQINSLYGAYKWYIVKDGK